MRTGAFRYLFFAFLLLLTDPTFGGFDWTPDAVGAVVLLLGLREVKAFDAEFGTGFGKAKRWGAALLLLGAGKAALLFFPAASSLLPWVCAGSAIAACASAWVCGAGVFRLAVQAGQHSLAAALRRGVFAACICCVSVACGKLLAAALGAEPTPLSSVIVTAASVAAAIDFGAQLLRAQKLLRPFFG